MATTSAFPPPSRTAISSSHVYETMDNHTTSHDDTPMSCGFLDRIEPALMATFVPCFTIARSTTHGRFNFALVFLAVLVLYGGGIASYIMAARVTDPVIISGTTMASGGWSLTPLTTVARTAWATYIIGPWATLAVDAFIWIGWEIRDAVHEDEDAVYNISSTALNLLVVHFVAQLLLTVTIHQAPCPETEIMLCTMPLVLQLLLLPQLCAWKRHWVCSKSSSRMR